MVTDLKCKCKDIFGEFMDKEMEQYVRKLYMHDRIMSMKRELKHHLRHVCLLKMLKEGKDDYWKSNICNFNDK